MVDIVQLATGHKPKWKGITQSFCIYWLSEGLMEAKSLSLGKRRIDGLGVIRVCRARQKEKSTADSKEEFSVFDFEISSGEVDRLELLLSKIKPTSSEVDYDRAYWGVIDYDTSEFYITVDIALFSEVFRGIEKIIDFPEGQNPLDL